MASITYWNRVEPSPRSHSLVRGLEARLRDPLWLLARQWQIGEFQGEDAASPAFVSLAASFSGFESVRTGDGPFAPIDGARPLEAQIEAEATTPDRRTAAELGQALERELREAGASEETVEAFRGAFLLAPAADGERSRDPALARFLRVCGGRAIDGLAALHAARAAAPGVPPEVVLPAGEDAARVTGALASLIGWVASTYGELGAADAPAWRPERLEYGAEVEVGTPTGDRHRLSARPGQHGELDWFSFDAIGADRNGGEAATTSLQSSIFPASVDFAGMPHRRWWQFEDGRFNWAGLDADRRELAKALVLDFMLVQGDDWFVVPFGQPVGSLAGIDQLTVRDVFGELTLVRRAGEEAGKGRWSMFATESALAAGDRAEYFVLPPSALRATIDGPDLEEVRLLRDEQANMVWAIEARTENQVGRPWEGHEQALGAGDGAPPPLATDSPLRYRLQTTAPVNWIPFVPVQVGLAHRAVALERAAMQRFSDGALIGVKPRGRILNPTGLADPELYRVNEEEVTRSGTRLLRAARRARWLDGGAALWTARRRRVGLGEGQSGLRFDVAELSDG